MTRQIGAGARTPDNGWTDEPHLARTKHSRNVRDMRLTTLACRILSCANWFCQRFSVHHLSFEWWYAEHQKMCHHNLELNKLATRSIFTWSSPLWAICRPVTPSFSLEQIISILCWPRWPHYSLPPSSVICCHLLPSPQINFVNSTTAPNGLRIVTPPVVNYRTLGKGEDFAWCWADPQILGIESHDRMRRISSLPIKWINFQTKIPIL